MKNDGIQPQTFSSQMSTMLHNHNNYASNYQPYWGYPPYWGQLAYTNPTIPELPKGYSIWYPNPWKTPILVPTSLLPSLFSAYSDSATGSTTSTPGSEMDLSPITKDIKDVKNRFLKYFL